MPTLEVTRNTGSHRTHTAEHDTLADAQHAYGMMCAFEERRLPRRSSGYVCTVRLLTDEGIEGHQVFTVAG
jgi:hypothetical protein